MSHIIFDYGYPNYANILRYKHSYEIRKNIRNGSQKTGIFPEDAKVTKIKFFSHEKTESNNL